MNPEPECEVEPEQLATAHRDGYAALVVRDQTASGYDFEALEKQPTARGRFVRRLLQEIADETKDETRRETARLALLAGLRALDGRARLAVWVSELDVRGFKHLRDRWTLQDGLTVVTGPNEAGKSTLHDVFIRLLFGFTRPERRKRHGFGTSVKDVCHPWRGPPFAVNARLEDVRGHSLLVEWDFDRHSVVLRQASTGDDLSSEVRGKRDEVALGEFLLQIGLNEFREACCLHQEGIAAVVHSEQLALALRRSVESGAADVGVEEADGRLATYLRERLGVHTGHYRELPGGPLAVKSAAIEDRRSQLMECLRERDGDRHACP